MSGHIGHPRQKRLCGRRPLNETRVAKQAESASEVAVADVLPEFADAFPFETFNAMQAETLPALLESDENVVVRVPTA